MNDSRDHGSTILIIDDDETLQEVLNKFLQMRGYVVRSLVQGEQLANFLEQHQTDLILLDIVTPEKGGLHWMRWIRQHHPHIPVLILSSKSTPEERLQGLEYGARDYLTKPFHPKELLIRIQHILPAASHSEMMVNGETYTIGLQVFDPQRECLIRSGEPVKLTHHESRLLHFFCQHAGQILSRDTISQALYGNDHEPFDRKIDMQITRLRKKLQDDLKTPQHLHTVWRKGYRFTP